MESHREEYQHIVEDLLSVGVDFSRPPAVLTKGEKQFYGRLCKERGVRIQQRHYSCIGSAFYARLRRLYQKMSSACRVPMSMDLSDMLLCFDGQTLRTSSALAGYVDGVLCEVRVYRRGFRWRVLYGSNPDVLSSRLHAIWPRAVILEGESELYVEYYKE